MNPMAGLEHIRQLYEDYLTEVARLERERKPGEGLLGMGGGPANDPCHDRFVQDLETQLQALLEARLPSDQVRAVLEYIYHIPVEHRDSRTAYWMLIAVHGLTLDLIGQITSADAQTLWTGYKAAYPRWERLPVQKQVFSALDKARKHT